MELNCYQITVLLSLVFLSVVVLPLWYKEYKRKRELERKAAEDLKRRKQEREQSRLARRQRIQPEVDWNMGRRARAEVTPSYSRQTSPSSSSTYRSNNDTYTGSYAYDSSDGGSCSGGTSSDGGSSGGCD